MSKVVVTLTGPSCAGKSTLEARLRERGFAAVVSHTTRAPRYGEKDGVSYHFTTPEKFSAMKAAGEFVETNELPGGSYGTSAAEYEAGFASGKTVVAVVDPNGRKNIARFARRAGWTHIPVFVDNDLEVVMRRFMHRVIKDSAAHRSEEGRAKVLDAAARRLALMIQTEHTAWKAEANSFESPYKLRIDKFDADGSDVEAENAVMDAVQIAKNATQSKALTP